MQCCDFLDLGHIHNTARAELANLLVHCEDPRVGSVVRWLGSCLFSWMVGWLVGWLAYSCRWDVSSFTELILAKLRLMSLAPHKFLGASLGHVMPNPDFAGMSQIGIPHLNHGPCNYWYLSLVVKLAMFLF